MTNRISYPYDTTRIIAEQSIPSGVTASFAANTLTLSAA